MGNRVIYAEERAGERVSERISHVRAERARAYYPVIQCFLLSHLSPNVVSVVVKRGENRANEQVTAEFSAKQVLENRCVGGVEIVKHCF